MAEIEPIKPVAAAKPIGFHDITEKPMDILNPGTFWAQISLQEIVKWLQNQVKSDNERMKEANEELKKVAEGIN